MEYLIRFAQIHETFRKPEIEALALLAQINVDFISYDENSPYAIVGLPTEEAARQLVSRSILSKRIYELWGVGSSCEELHTDVKQRTGSLKEIYKTRSFKFVFDTFQGSISSDEQTKIINSFSYLDFQGTIRVHNPEETFVVFSDYHRLQSHPSSPTQLRKLFLGRLIATSQRDILDKYTLKKRQYINTTSMDAELAFITANISLARPNTIFYDPFVGTGSFSVACAHFGAYTLGSDIDGRVLRGLGKPGNLKTNFQQYGLQSQFLASFIADLTHSPLRQAPDAPTRFLDGIICDPPYGIREGLKVLGSANAEAKSSTTEQPGEQPMKKEALIIDGTPAYLRDDYIPPKRPYSLEAMLDDILHFAACTLVDNGRVSLWMPTANEEAQLSIPQCVGLELLSVCVQKFTKWSRRLLTYRRLPGVEVCELSARTEIKGRGRTADELNDFRRKYFQGFRADFGSQQVAETGKSQE